MKTKMIIKFNKFISYENAFKVKKDLLKQWRYEEAILLHPDIDIQAIILENDKGEITVINLRDKKVKTRKNILKKIQKLFKRKNKCQNLDT